MNVTDMKLPEKLVLSATRDTADTVVFDADLSSCEGFTFGKRAKCSFEKAPDGTVSVADADVIPTWVNMSTVNGQKEYNILPLDDATRDQWKTSFNLTDALYQEAVASYDRTMAIVGDGLTEVQTWLTGNAA